MTRTVYWPQGFVTCPRSTLSRSPFLSTGASWTAKCNSRSGMRCGVQRGAALRLPSFGASHGPLFPPQPLLLTPLLPLPLIPVLSLHPMFLLTLPPSLSTESPIPSPHPLVSLRTIPAHTTTDLLVPCIRSKALQPAVWLSWRGGGGWGGPTGTTGAPHLASEAARMNVNTTLSPAERVNFVRVLFYVGNLVLCLPVKVSTPSPGMQRNGCAKYTRCEFSNHGTFYLWNSPTFLL